VPTPLAEAGQAAAVKQATETNPLTETKPVTETKSAAEPNAVVGATAAAGPEAAAEPKAAAGPEAGAAAKSSGAGVDGKAGTGDSGLAETKVGEIDLDKPAVVTVTSASGRRVTQVLRHANPIRAARTAGRTTHAWAKRPTGRLLIPAIIAVLLIGAAGTAGAYLVPEALEAAPSPSATPGFPLDGAAAGPSAVSVAPAPSAPPLSGTAPTFANVVGARPADALAGWAQGVGTRIAIPVVAVQAYGYAELVVTRTAPNCHLSWTTIAAIASVESSHGSANGAVLGADGSVQPPIYGLQLDGKGGRQLIRDTDQGLVDSDPAFDRAVGPLQFIPSTWNEMKVDADNSGAPDPNDIDDASLAAALYLCKGGRDLSKADAWWDAILSYNAVRPYAQKVFDTANEYGVRSRV